MANQHSPKPRPLPAYSWNQGRCFLCGHTWFYNHPVNGFEVITRFCPTCLEHRRIGVIAA